MSFLRPYLSHARNFQLILQRRRLSTMDDLTERLSKLGQSGLTSYPNSNPELNPIDIYRSHITDQLAQITTVDPQIIYPTLQWPPSLDKGDLILAVPALRIKGKKPAELATELAEKVRPGMEDPI